MPKQASKVWRLSFFIVLSLLANYRISAKPLDQSYATAASESANKAVSSESLPVLPNPDSPNTDQVETFSPTDVSFPPSANIPDVETKSDETLSQENISTLSGAEPTDLQTEGEENLSQENASSPSVNDPTLETEGDENIYTSLSPSNVGNPAVDTQYMDSLSQENTSSPPSTADPPAVETEESTEDLFQENTFLPPSPSVDVPAVETEESTEDLFQENTSLPPSPSVDVPAVETVEDENVSEENSLSEETQGNEMLSQENPSVPSSSPIVDTPDVEENKSPALAPAYGDDTPALETSEDGSFDQENQSPVTYVNAPAPETKGEQDITNTDDYSSATPPNTEIQTPENVPELNDYSSLPETAVPAPSESLSFPESDPTIPMAPSNDDTFGLAPTSHQTTFSYTTEDEPVEPYEDEKDSWNAVHGAVAGVLVGACVIGLAGFIYQKRKKDNITPQYQSLTRERRGLV